jgi:diphthine synthase
MSIPVAVRQLAEVEEDRKGGIIEPSKTLAIAMSRVGGGPGKERIVAGTLEQLGQAPEELFGDPLHSLVIVGKRLHPLEVQFAKRFAIDEMWMRASRDAYGVVEDY